MKPIQVPANAIDFEPIADTCATLSESFIDMARALYSFARTKDPKDYFRARGIHAGIAPELADLNALFTLIRYVEEPK